MKILNLLALKTYIDSQHVLLRSCKAPEGRNKALEERSKALEERSKALEEHSKALEECSMASEERSNALEERSKALEEGSNAPEGRSKASGTRQHCSRPLTAKVIQQNKTAAAKFTPTCLLQPRDHLVGVKVISMKC